MTTKFTVMGVEEDLQVKLFKNEYHKLRVNLLLSASWLSTHIKNFLDPFEITQKQFNILRILRGHKEELPLTILEIREKMIDKMSDASRIIDRLQKKGLLQKQPCTIDKRATRIQITDSGLQLLSEIDRHLPKLDTLLKNLSETEAEKMNNLLDEMRKEGK